MPRYSSEHHVVLDGLRHEVLRTGTPGAKEESLLTLRSMVSTARRDAAVEGTGTTAAHHAAALVQLAETEFATAEFEASALSFDAAEAVLRRGPDLPPGDRPGRDWADGLAEVRIMRSRVNGMLRRPLSAIADVQRALDHDARAHLAQAAWALTLAGYDPEVVARMADADMRSATGARLVLAARMSAVAHDRLGASDAEQRAWLATLGVDHRRVLAVDVRQSARPAPPVRTIADVPRGAALDEAGFVVSRLGGDALVADLLAHQRKAAGDEVIALGLEVHALCALSDVPTADRVESLILLGDAYADEGDVAQLDDVVRWLRRLARQGEVPRAEAVRLAARLEARVVEPVVPPGPAMEVAVLSLMDIGVDVPDRAADAFGLAAELLAVAVRDRPSEPCFRQYGATLYASAGALIADDDFEAAVRASDEAEKAYSRVSGLDERIADVRLRRARALASLGRPLGVVADTQRCLDHYADRPVPGRVLAHAAFAWWIVGVDPHRTARAADTVLAGRPEDDRASAVIAAQVSYRVHRLLGERPTLAYDALKALGELAWPEAEDGPVFPLSLPRRLSAVLRPEVAGPERFVPARLVGGKADRVCAKLLALARDLPPAEAVAVALEIHAVRSPAGVPTPDWADAVAILARAYGRLGLAPAAAEAEELHARLDRDRPRSFLARLRRK
ncbi:hypothetical protein GCM10022243_02120 [Saccharothrix violaceirubra]|uniref:Tetratricopeptide (TPR) repeat protein n=1 Tax=Saccharothrix violaceirubra TaxID=413306 RepID=A0A7W7WWD1_9PSEU|nr:hypothetical protein [Saccharothrix violaceirubra]MBB4965971.1 tetratricopeptide (TPR) repeat protein [Saccharothrix violaceirubra]